jgi:transcription elongation factor Elf1
MLLEQRFQCPYCGAQISMMLDLTVPDQQYVEDCEVCCQAVAIAYEVAQDSSVRFRAERLDS